jgi:hypothetical protein
MDDHMSKVANVRVLVSSAFAEVPRPAHVTKRVAVAMDDEWLADPDRRVDAMESMRWGHVLTLDKAA